MDNNLSNKNGDPVIRATNEAPSIKNVSKSSSDGLTKKRRRRGKSKRKLLKPFIKVSWKDKRKSDTSKRNNRYRKLVMAKTHAPFNNNQFLMEIHKPESDNAFQILQTPSARTRDSSFSVDSEDNYFFSLPEDEEEYLTKEFSSVYEDAQTERLSNMSKNELIQEFLLLEAKYDNLIKRTERSKPKSGDDDIVISNTGERDISATDQDSMITDRDTSGTSVDSCTFEEPSFSDLIKRLRDQEEKIHELEVCNEKLLMDNQRLRQKSLVSSSEDSESDSTSTTDSDSNSSQSVTCVDPGAVQTNTISLAAQMNGQKEMRDLESTNTVSNGFCDASD